MPSKHPASRLPARGTEPRRVAWVTPDYPPDRGGVSDHSREIVNVLRASGHDVLVCSKPHERGFARLDGKLATYGPDLVVVVYTPLGYAPRTGGIAPAFAAWTAGLRSRLGCQAILLAHEVSLPARLHWHSGEIKLAALGAVQIAQFWALAKNFDSVLFSNAGTLRAWAQRHKQLAARFHTVRICSNIPYISTGTPTSALLAAGYSVSTPTVLYFGTGHQSALLDYLEQAFLALLSDEPNAVLVIIGMSPEKLRQLRPSLAELGAKVNALGYVPSEQVSLWLQVATLVLSPLVEGVSARKGTVMAALQHGRAVVTTRGIQTCDDIAWDEICLLAPLNRERFAEAAVRALRSPELRAAIGTAARAEYDAHASASVTAVQILAYADEHASRGARQQ